MGPAQAVMVCRRLLVWYLFWELVCLNRVPLEMTGSSQDDPVFPALLQNASKPEVVRGKHFYVKMVALTSQTCVSDQKVGTSSKSAEPLPWRSHQPGRACTALDGGGKHPQLLFRPLERSCYVSWVMQEDSSDLFWAGAFYCCVGWAWQPGSAAKHLIPSCPVCSV